MQNVALKNFYAVVKEINIASTEHWANNRWIEYRKNFILIHHGWGSDPIPDPQPIWRMPYGFTWGTPYIIIGSEGLNLFLLNDNNDIHRLCYTQIKLIHPNDLLPGRMWN